MNKSEIRYLTKKYFECFRSQNIVDLKSMYADDVVISDPTTSRIEGVESVLKSNTNLFGQFTSIDIQLRSLYIDIIGNTSVSEFIFLADGNANEVVDIISFDQNKKIVRVIAYFGKNVEK